ncbi:hypothetical protein TGVEG_269420 [Toxoplasma gondii VEG]|uniref:TTF-type domain-containing protein n=3 Tax=Toxoplasma gondii TaxID=5811 RepID=V4Z893_TOXGV|nr:hypothetical protein TGVEG_269420 [Toxoplasma gondii VEG]KFG52386.1 hypothetical protein TGP89_269420 [Toxoplasma gondii p89]PUA87771.1 hypothetical protein TGBR9_269420 [Toxoplasma gondii TgCATBr9]CEL75400.1 TPA: hypothetical protein BN1205_016640 [Toxoplasma gondii VEG]
MMSAAVSSTVCSFFSAFRVRGASSPLEASPRVSTPAYAAVEEEALSSRLAAVTGPCAFVSPEQNVVLHTDLSREISADTLTPGATCPSSTGCGSTAFSPNSSTSGTGTGQGVVRRKQLSGAQKRKRKRELLAKNRVEPASLFSFLSTTVTSEAIYENWQDLNRAIREESARYEARTLSASSPLMSQPETSTGGGCCCCARALVCWTEERGGGSSVTLCGADEDAGGQKRPRHCDILDDSGVEGGSERKKHCCSSGADEEKRRLPVNQERLLSPSCHARGRSDSSTRNWCVSSRESGKEDEDDCEEDEGHRPCLTSPSAATSPTSCGLRLPCASTLHESWRLLLDESRSHRSTRGSSHDSLEAVDVLENKDGAERVDVNWHAHGIEPTGSSGAGDDGAAASHVLRSAEPGGDGQRCRSAGATMGDACSTQRPLLPSLTGPGTPLSPLATAEGRDRLIDCFSPCGGSNGSCGSCSTRHSSCCSSLRGDGSGGSCCSPPSPFLSPVSDDASSVTSSVSPSSPPRLPRQSSGPGPVSPHSSPRLVARCVCTRERRDEQVHDGGFPALAPLRASPGTPEDEDELDDLALWPSQITEELRWSLVKKGPVQLVDFPYPRDATQRRFGRQHYWRTLPSGEKLWRSWLVYSRTRDAVYCFCCKLFSQLSKSVVTTGFRRWKGIAEVLRSHEHSRDHRSCMLQWKCLCLRLHADVSFGDLKQLCMTTPSSNAVGGAVKGDGDDGEARAAP